MLIPENKQFDIWGKDLTIPVLALDIVIFTIYNDELCVITQKMNENSNYGNALPGGIVAKGFSLDENFDNILFRKTGIKGVYKEQLYTFGDPKRDDRGHVVAVCYYALVRVDNFLTNVDFTKVDIIKFSDLDKIKLFYDHNNIVKYAKQRLEWKLEYTNIANQILPKSFRMSQLQHIYEVITGKNYDKRNFQKKILSLNILKETGELDRSTNRPAKLYEFISNNIEIIENNSLV